MIFICLQVICDFSFDFFIDLIALQQQVVQSLHICDFPTSLLVILFLGSNHCDQKRSLFWFQFLNCTETCSVSHHTVYPWEISHALEKNVYSAANNYFIYCYFVVPVLGAYMVIAIVFLMNFSFIIIYCPFSFVTFVCLFVFCLDVYFVWYEYGYAHFLLAEFAYLLLISLSSINELTFYSFIISLCLSLELKWVLRRQYIAGFFFFFLQSTQSFYFFLLVNSIHLHLGWSLIGEDLLLPFNLFSFSWLVCSFIISFLCVSLCHFSLWLSVMFLSVSSPFCFVSLL